MSAPTVNAPSTNPNHQVAAPARRRSKANRNVVNPTNAFRIDSGISARTTSVSISGRRAARSSWSWCQVTSTSGANSTTGAAATGSAAAGSPLPSRDPPRRRR